MITPSTRERDLTAAFLIDIGPPLGALRVLRGMEDWTGSEVALSALRNVRRDVEGQAAELWFGFASFCRGTLRRKPATVLGLHHPPFLPTFGDLLRTLRPDPVRVAQVRRELEECWLLTTDCEVV